jgi:hypothetical protein
VRQSGWRVWWASSASRPERRPREQALLDLGLVEGAGGDAVSPRVVTKAGLRSPPKRRRGPQVRQKAQPLHSRGSQSTPKEDGSQELAWSSGDKPVSAS